MPNKAIVLFLDGTRNTAKDETNVQRLYVKTMDGKTTDGLEQKCWYYDGVGTRPTDFISGAIWGRGVSKNVRDAYEHLCKVYEPGDRLFIFGFSRGAFTARSLAGFIAHYGVLKRDSAMRVEDLYTDYKTANPSRPMLYLDMQVKKGEQVTEEEQKRYSQAWIASIHFLGVWDTVGTIGLPVPAGSLSQRENRFHMMAPRAAYEICRQALAVDEKRPHYRPILWKRFVTAAQMNEDNTPPPLTDTQKNYEQRWFIGAHSDVGGGYKNPTGLHKISLKWMEDEAAKATLGIANRQQLDGTEHLQPMHDSFKEFWPYKLAFWTKPDPRPLLREGEPKTAKKGDGAGSSGWVFTLNEVVDSTVYDRAAQKIPNPDGSPYKLPKIGI